MYYYVSPSNFRPPIDLSLIIYYLINLEHLPVRNPLSALNAQYSKTLINAIMREQYNPFVTESNLEGTDGRLPTNVKPTHYDVRLEPDLESASFNGSATIHLDVLKKTTFILLNAVELDILTTEVVDNSGSVTKIPIVYYNKKQQTVMVPLYEPIPAGSRILLSLIFNGRLNDSKTNAGFNRSSYKGFDGKSKWICSTQCEPTGARQIFPCVDEPALKATFSATMVVDQGLTCLSNMDIVSEELNEISKKMVIFSKTPPMSTYLIAFIVGELNYIESNNFRIPIRIYATPDEDINRATFALDVAVRAMTSHEETFGLPYPLPKLDMIAIPGHTGAMENWGCVIYAYKSLIWDRFDIPASDAESMAHTVIHELAHQWFGNIVTMAWWDSLWLNESFADWATYNAMTHMFPDWDVWSGFVAGRPRAGLNAYQAALTLDSNRGSHPIEAPVSTPEQISQIFDAITYSKGCSILRMISEYLGVDVFIEGVRLYLQTHAFGNSTTNDLWNSLSIVSGQDVQKIMSIWTEKVGYPVLSITEDETSDEIKISQHRYLRSGKMQPDEDQVLYPVYLKMKYLGGVDLEAQLLDREGKFPVDLKFYKLNGDQTGLYRVSYPLSRWKKLGEQLSSNFLSPDDRVGLISDFSAVVTSGQNSNVRTSDLLSFLQKFQSENNYFVWRQILVCIQDIRKAWMFEDTETQLALSTFQTQLMTPVLNQLGKELWNIKPSDSHRNQNFKGLLFSSGTDNASIKAASLYLFNRLVNGDHKPLNPNIRRAVFDAVLSDENASSTQVSALSKSPLKSTICSPFII